MEQHMNSPPSTFDLFMDGLQQLCKEHDVKISTGYDIENDDGILIVSNVMDGEQYISTCVEDDFVENLKIH
jgi:hypothetical protein